MTLKPAFFAATVAAMALNTAFASGESLESSLNSARSSMAHMNDIMARVRSSLNNSANGWVERVNDRFQMNGEQIVNNARRPILDPASPPPETEIISLEEVLRDMEHSQRRYENALRYRR